MAQDNRKFFGDTDFDKVINLGQSLVFDKQDLTILRIELTWGGTDLDVCAFMLAEDEMIHSKEDLVYFNSALRWKTEKSFDDPEFNPLKGKFSKWEDETDYKNPRKWLQSTLPISLDGSVIGSWDDGASDDDEECSETMHVLLEEVDTRKYSSIILAAAVAKAKILQGETFEDAKHPVVRIYDAETDNLIVEYKLDTEFIGKDVVCFGNIVYNSQEMLWSFEPMAEGYKGGMMYLAREVYN